MDSKLSTLGYLKNFRAKRGRRSSPSVAELLNEEWPPKFAECDRLRVDGNGFRLQLIFPLMALLTFCRIIRKRDHHKF